MFNNARQKKYLVNCNTSFCCCDDCKTEGEKLALNERKISDFHLNIPKHFKCCEHGLCVKGCNLCQIRCFENVVGNHLIKDVKNLISAIVKQQPIEKIYCCRCENGYKIMSPKNLIMNNYKTTYVCAKKCDSRIAFRGTKVLIVSNEFSKYGDDGFTITAGIFSDINGRFLSEKQVKQIYNVQNNILVCDRCIDDMLENEELISGGGFNE